MGEDRTSHSSFKRLTALLLPPHPRGSKRVTDQFHNPPRLSSGLKTRLKKQPPCCDTQVPFHTPDPLLSDKEDRPGWEWGWEQCILAQLPIATIIQIKFYNLCYGSKSPWLAVSSCCRAPWHSCHCLKFQTRKRTHSTAVILS